MGCARFGGSGGSRDAFAGDPTVSASWQRRDRPHARCAHCRSDLGAAESLLDEWCCVDGACRRMCGTQKIRLRIRRIRQPESSALICFAGDQKTSQTLGTAKTVELFEQVQHRSRLEFERAVRIGGHVVFTGARVG